jgi:tetratricopeptide (TPR) repeat protein
MAQDEFGEPRGIMRIDRILWVLAAFLFTSVLYAQMGQAPTWPRQSQIGAPEIPAQSQGQAQKPPPAGEKGKTQGQGPVPLTEKEVTKEIKSSPAETVIKDVKQRGVDFELTADIEKKLRKAKATEEVIEAVRQAGPKARAQMAKLPLGPSSGGQQALSKEEAEAYDAIRNELDLDKTIALANDFVKKYPSSRLLTFVYSFAANAYRQKGDAENVVDATGKGLKLDPDNLWCLLLSLGMLPQPQYLNNHAAERDKILQEAESEASHALQLIAQLPNRSNEADVDHQKRQAELASEVHGSLGMVHLERALESLAGPDKAELGKAEQEFKTAVSTTDRPEPEDYFRMGETYSMDGKVDDALEAFTKASELGQGTLLKTLADQRVEELRKRKARGSAAPNPK